jgi:hypothetical protein
MTHEVKCPHCGKDVMAFTVANKMRVFGLDLRAILALRHEFLRRGGKRVEPTREDIKRAFRSGL